MAYQSHIRAWRNGDTIVFCLDIAATYTLYELVIEETDVGSAAPEDSFFLKVEVNPVGSADNHEQVNLWKELTLKDSAGLVTKICFHFEGEWDMVNIDA
jgi:hypothetical protein